MLENECIMMQIIEDKYDGVIVDSAVLPDNRTDFLAQIEQLIESISNKQLMWIKVPIEKSDFIPILTNCGFEFHHCDEKWLMLVKKLVRDATVPTTKNYIVGVGAIVFHNGLLLVVKDRFSVGYKLPGGHVDKNESIKNALKREVFEETGIDVDFESIVNIGHFRNGQFGESNLYLVCTAKAKSTQIIIVDSTEIVDAKWISPEDFLTSDTVNNYNKSVVNAAINNKELKLTEQQVKLRMPDGEVFF
jgi:8-oxo-dGTP diphosphatase